LATISLSFELSVSAQKLLCSGLQAAKKWRVDVLVKKLGEVIGEEILMSLKRIAGRFSLCFECILGAFLERLVRSSRFLECLKYCLEIFPNLFEFFQIFSNYFKIFSVFQILIFSLDSLSLFLLSFDELINDANLTNLANLTPKFDTFPEENQNEAHYYEVLFALFFFLQLERLALVLLKCG